MSLKKSPYLELKVNQNQVENDSFLKKNSRLRLKKREGEVIWSGENKNWFKMNWKTSCMNKSDRTKGRN
jgi:hypothetical protein